MTRVDLDSADICYKVPESECECVRHAGAVIWLANGAVGQGLARVLQDLLLG